ncbi:SusC/RagA family TonB-linked outer membrane protein [Chishuiella sp.]|uniref:SusC/RagA family TonB-linked outer membrane protein n=1 Tax=Chishuiella sp. TaxID=1969467 RepID=UPI0028A85D7E|nr:SusC/RagA family TonB-linked outer membrane protein [Chishuiella sp.]
MRRNLRNLFVLGGILLGSSLYAQDVKTVTGIVTDSDGLPVADAIVKSTSGVEVFTDESGSFSIEAKQGDLVTVEAVGLPTQTFKVGEQSSYNVSLKPTDTVELEGAVVTALGITRDKKSLGYASQEVKGDIISQGRGTNALQSLSGNVAGAQITAPSGLGTSARIVLRGIGSITGENRPLIVVDGIPMDNSNYNSTNAQRGSGGRDYGDGSFDINPDDVESVNVLKGGPAAALYGSRANNGVIMITTKSAKKGKDEIVINTGVAFESLNIQPKLQQLYGGGFSSEFEQVKIGDQTYSVVDYGADESWGPRLNGQQVLHWDAFDSSDPNTYLKTRAWSAPSANYKTLYNTGIAYTNSVSFAKSYENTSARMSVSQLDQSGIIPNSSLKRTTANLNLVTKFNDKLTAKGGITYVNTTGSNRPEFGYGDNSIPQKMYQWGQVQLDYNRLKNYKTATGEQRSWNRTAWNDATPKYSDNPYWILYENTSKDKRDRFYGNFELKYDIAPGLYAVGNIYGDNTTLNISSIVAEGSQAQAGYNESTREKTEMNYEGRLHFDKKFGEFSINAFAGVNRRHESYSSMSANTNGGFIVPGLYTINNSLQQASVTTYKWKRRVNSAYASASLGYADLVFIEASARNDWSSTLPSGDNSYFYPSVTGSFIFSQLIKASWLKFGKVRGGWSKTGNDAPVLSIVDVYENNAFSGSSFIGDPYYLTSLSKKNQFLKPETKKAWEFGLEMQMFNNRLGFDVSYYHEETSDLIMPVTVGAETGFTSKMLNAGKTLNKGIEAMVNIVPIRTSEFEWGINVNFSKNSNRVTELIDGVESIQLGTAPFKATLDAVLGERYGQIRGTDFIYDDKGNKVVGANGLYLSSDIKNLGSIIPDWNMGIRNNISYKNFSLSALLDIQKGGKYFSVTNMFGMYSGMLEETAANGVRENGVVVSGVTGNVVSNGDGTYTVTNTAENNKNVTAQQYYGHYYSGPTAQNVFDADYFKLREVTISYTFPKNLRGPFSNVVISAFGRNLATWGLDNKNIDPEQASGGSGNVQGLEGGSLPSTRTYGMNLKLQF